MDNLLVSVLMPVLNEERFVAQALDSILAQNYPNLEILVIDGGSKDRTCEIVRDYQQNDSRIRLIHNPGKWQVRALNIGLNEARGHIIMRVDGHAILETGYIEHAVRHLMLENGVDNVGGVHQAVGLTPMGKAIAVAHGSPFAVPSLYRTSSRDTYVDSLFMGAWRRDLFERIGGWNEKFTVTEDYEHNYRIRQKGGKILLTTDMRSVYYCRNTLPQVWQQYSRYARGRVMMLRHYPKSLRIRQVVAPAFVAALLCGLVLSVFIEWVRYLWGSMVGLYLIAALVEALRLSRGDWGLLWRLPLVFATLHISWGIGFWRAVGESLFGKKNFS
jgi:glycosyltransferase involved in cell wall biosynthesis